MTLDWTVFAIDKGVDLLMLGLIPFVAWLFRNRIKRWYKGNDKEKKENFKPEGMGM